jgi:A/G-specific adenine glycosylase
MRLPGRALGAFRRQLLAWFRAHQRDLPWRRTNDPYRIWLSEIMLQQTRVAAVLPYYERFLVRFPDLHTLASAPEQEVLRFWSGLGYYRRARNLQRAAQQIITKHGGQFPREENAVLALPGIGRYTASAILSFAFGAKHAVLDGNVARVLARIFTIRGELRAPRRWKALQKSADQLLERKAPSDWNQAMMELGAVVCTPRAPQCLLCPVSRFCRGRQLGIAELFPATRQKSNTVEIALTSAVLVDDQGHTLLASPPGNSDVAKDGEIGALVSKMWHFPTRAVRENPALELRALLKELSGKRTCASRWPVEPLPKVRHTVTFRKITVHPFCVQVIKMPKIPGAKVVALSELARDSSLAISSLTRKIARAAWPAPTPSAEENTALLFSAASA